MRILDLYLLSRHAAIYAANLASFTVLYVLVDSMSQYGALSQKVDGFPEFLQAWFRFYSAQVPVLFCRVLGAVTATASAIFAVTLFQRSNEFTPVLGAGISLRRFLAPVMALTAISALGSLAVQEGWIPARRTEIREARALGRGRAVAPHVKYWDPRQRFLVVFRQYHLKQIRGEGVLVLSPKKFLLEAAAARWIEGEGRRGDWNLEDGFIQEYDPEGKVIPQSPPPGFPSKPPWLQRTFKEMAFRDLVEAEMLPSDLEERESQEAYLWMGELLSKVKRSPDSPRWRIRLFSRLADPLHGLILVVLGVPTILAWGTRNIFLSAFATIAISALYFVAYTIFLNLGNRGALSPGLAVGLAPLLFGALGITLYARMRT